MYSALNNIVLRVKVNDATQIPSRNKWNRILTWVGPNCQKL